MRITFKAPSENVEWLVFVERETTTLYLVDVPHAALGVPHDPDDQTALANAVKASALAKLTAGEATVLGTNSEVDVLTWERLGSPIAERALAYHTGRFADGEAAPPGAVTLDLTTEQSARDAVAALDSRARERLAAALESASHAQLRATALHHIREALAEDAPGQDAIGVVFPTWGGPDGYLMNHNGTVLFADGTSDELDFGDDVEDALKALYGPRGESFTVAVDLRTDAFDESDSDTEADVHVRFAPRG